jgi:MerR family transcriptional regulator/heat shock protein HspR
MTPTIIPRDQAAANLSVPSRLLVRYEQRGLVRAVREGELEGYPPSEVRRLWTIVSCQRELGINLAGVEAILKLRDHLSDVHHRLSTLASELREALDHEKLPVDADG